MWTLLAGRDHSPCPKVGTVPGVLGRGGVQEASRPKQRQYFSHGISHQPPIQVLRNIVAMLEIEDRMLLRGVSRIFYEMIQRPTHSELLAIETKPWARHNIFACDGCIRLRHYDDSDTDNTSQHLNREQGRLNAHDRFCRECGVRDMLGEFRYQLGETWNDEYFEAKWWMRCYDCGRIEEIRYDVIQEDDDVCEVCDEDGRRGVIV